MLITPFLVGLKKAKEILMLGETLTAQEALELGLVNKVVADEDLMTTANTWAEKLSKLPQNTVRSNKAIIRRVYELAGFDDAIMYQDVPEITALIEKGDEKADRQHEIREKEGWNAFKEVRDQDYTSSD
jgi:enoyl-CoA hydratase/carnithine racemase